MKIFYRVSAGLFLFIMVVLSYLPFLNLRVLRMAGDEKVYVSTAIEMARSGNWFVQTLAGEPNYFKPPLHYLFVRAGMLFFGNSLLAGTWMNLFFALLAAMAFFWVGKKAWDERTGILLGLIAALNVGVYSHALASQMEVEIAAFYTMAIAALFYSSSKTIAATTHKQLFFADLPFWLVTGAAGWVKSPVYSALIGVSGLLYWVWSRQFRQRIKSWGSWLALLCGIVFCISIYLPILAYDSKNFIDTFLIRENLAKANNNRSWTYVATPLLYFAMPWTMILIFGIVHVIRETYRHGVQSWKSVYAKTERDMMKLGLSVALPSFLMWCLWTYKGQNYNLPTLTGFFLFAVAALHRSIPKYAYRIAGVLGLLSLFLIFSVIEHFWPLPGWWWVGWLALSFGSLLAFSLIFIFSRDVRNLGFGAMLFFVGFSSFVVPLGEREMIDVRAFVRAHPSETYYYYDLEPSIWSEWGLLQLTIGKEIFGLHKPKQLSKALEPGSAVLIPTKTGLDFIRQYYEKNIAKPEMPKSQIIPWARWLTKGKNADGESRWDIAWKSRDLSLLEREFYIFWIPAR